MRNNNVLISGASVAGPALAYWLRRYGFQPTIVERAPAPRPGGQAVDIRGAAREVIERMGLMASVRAAHTGVRGMAYVHEDGRRAVDWPQELTGDSGGIIAEIEILRADLVRLLHEKTDRDVEYLFDESITGIEQSDAGVRVSFARAAPRTFDLVIGADGIRSNVRSLAFGAESEFVTDSGHYLAVFPADPGLETDGWELMCSFPATEGAKLGRMAAVYPMRERAASRVMLAFAGPDRPELRGDLLAQQRFVADTFADTGWVVPRLVAQLRASEDFYLYRPGVVRVPGWSRGRVTLVGDANCAGSVGQGTSIALVGAYVLAGELAAAGGDHRVAFTRYEEMLREYVRLAQRPMPGGLKGFLPPTRSRIRLRNAMMRVLLGSPLRTMITKGMQETTTAVELRDYREFAVPSATASGSAAPIGRRG